MRSGAVFIYGFSAGLVIAWAVTAQSPDTEVVAGWFALAGSLTLALALLVHWRSVVRARGRRWRKTRD